MSLQNYSVSRTGFIVEDKESGHILQVSYKDEVYGGLVLMPEQSMKLPLDNWSKSENPFENDNCFSGMQTGYAPSGYWWFRISPSIPFSEIMKKVEGYKNAGGVFSRKFKPKSMQNEKFVDFVPKNHSTGYVFANIMNDMGDSAELIMKSSASIRMTYGYARRCAATALYLQGLLDRDQFDHNMSVFKGLQIQTEHSVEFQEQAFSNAIEFIKTYGHFINRKLIRQIISVEMNFVSNDELLDDSSLIEAIIDSYED